MAAASSAFYSLALIICSLERKRELEAYGVLRCLVVPYGASPFLLLHFHKLCFLSSRERYVQVFESKMIGIAIM